MDYLKLCDSDYRFMSIVWEFAPVNSGELVKLCSDQLGWKKSTTYTAIKKLSEKGYIKNENATVTVLIPKERVQKDESNYFVERTFGGSLHRHHCRRIWKAGIKGNQNRYSGHSSRHYRDRHAAFVFPRTLPRCCSK